MTDLDRLIQIEDIWTRRIIMEPIRNIERRAEFEAVKQLWRLWPTKPRETALETALAYNFIANQAGARDYLGIGNIYPIGYGKQSL